MSLIQNKPRIMHVLLSLEVGGAEQLVYRMVTSYTEGSRPIACCLLTLGKLGKQLKREGYKVYCRNHQGGIDLGITKWLRKIIQDEKIDVVHAHTYTPLFYSAPAAIMLNKVKVVYTEHGRLYPERHNWKKFLINPLLAHFVDHLVSISKSTAKAMNKYDNFPLNRIKIIHNGIDTPQSNPDFDIAAKKHSLGMGESSRVIGTAARIEDIKNISMMIRALRYVVEKIPDACLLVAGEGSKVQELINFAATVGVANKVYFIGHRDDLWDIYQIMEIFLLSSFTEGISLALLEAMASGVPAVVTDVGGNSEIVANGVTGDLIPINDDKSMAEEIILLLNDKEKSKLYSLNSKKKIADDFSFDSMMKSYYALYN